jgi:hypothetical protein
MSTTLSESAIGVFDLCCHQEDEVCLSSLGLDGASQQGKGAVCVDQAEVD